MMKTLEMCASFLNTSQTYVDSVANNIANVNTDRYKAERIRFTDLLNNYYPNGRSSSANTIDKKGEELLGNVHRIGEAVKIFNPGNIKSTSDPMDLAIDGYGFIKVISPNGEELFSRGGTLKVNDEMVIVDSYGNKIDPEMQLPEEFQNFSISPGGKVTAVNDSGGIDEIGYIPIYNFNNPGGLIAKDYNTYVQTTQSGVAAEGVPGTNSNGFLRQGFTEMSNVDLIEEMARLIEAKQAYGINTRSIKTVDEMWGMANNLRGK